MKKETIKKLNLIKQDIIFKTLMMSLSEKMEVYGDLSSWCIEAMLFEFNNDEKKQKGGTE